MADIRKLRARISSLNLTMVTVAKEAGILRETLYNRMNAGGNFRASEIEGLSKVLNLTKKERDEIFFADECVIKRNNSTSDEKGE